MSYTKVKSIKFNKEFTKYNILGASNNVYPKTYTWNNKWDNIDNLLEFVSGGEYQTIGLSAKKMIITEVITFNTIKTMQKRIKNIDNSIDFEYWGYKRLENAMGKESNNKKEVIQKTKQKF